MRMQTNDTITQSLANGITVKGSFQHSLNGTHFNLYVLSSNGIILGSKALGTRSNQGDASEFLKNEIARITHGLKLYKVGTLSTEAIQAPAVEYVLRILYRRKSDN